MTTADSHLVPGSHLGPYEIIGILGAGGMGEVYRALDPRLRRHVAVKVLRASTIDDADRLRRFEAEARAAGALEHPNILVVYDIGQHGDVPYIVSELLEGETLRHRLREGGALAVRQVLDYAGQVARGLAAAHQQGIVHRDVKPENLFLTRDGRVKILDFGLAKLVPDPGADGPTASVEALTKTGIVLGTVGYMAPEQVRSGAVDHRADIFALGVVMYEMLSGVQPFRRPTTAETLTAILKDDPPAQAPVVPRRLDRLVRRCLEKRPHDRFHSAHDLALALDDAAQTEELPIPATSGPGRRRLLAPAVAALVAAGLTWLAMLTLGQDPSVDPSAVRRFSMDLGLVRPVISPNGRHIAYRLDGRLWVRDLASETPREIPAGRASLGFNSDEAFYLTWSPDSRDIAFLAGDELRRVSALEGGEATTICPLPSGPPQRRWLGGMAWSDDGDTIVFSRYGAGIYEVAAGGGPPALLWEENHADDLILFDTPRGRAVLFAVTGEGGAGHALIVRMPGGERRYVTQLNSNWPELVYSPTGHVLYRMNPVQSPSIWALPFSPQTLDAEGEPFLVHRQGFQASLSSEGTLVYLDPGPPTSQHLAWRDRSGSPVAAATDGHGVIEALSLSPDGDQAVVVAQDAGQNGLWLYDLNRFGRRRVALGSEAEDQVPLYAIWSRVTDEIYYTVTALPPRTAIFRMPATGAGEARALPLPNGLPFPEGFTVLVDSSDEGPYFMAVHGSTPSAPSVSVWFWRNDTVDTEGEAVELSVNAGDTVPQFAPDARHVAYVSRASGRPEIWVQSFPDGRLRRQISFRGGTAPVWAPDGTELFFNERDTLMRVAVSTAGELVASPPEPLFAHLRLTGTPAPYARYAVSPDGQRFLTVEADGEATAPVVRLVQGWLSEFGRRD